jgi:hypothetical protein
MVTLKAVILDSNEKKKFGQFFLGFKILTCGYGKNEFRRNKRALLSIRRMPFLLGIEN